MENWLKTEVMLTNLGIVQIALAGVAIGILSILIALVVIEFVDWGLRSRRRLVMSTTVTEPKATEATTKTVVQRVIKAGAGGGAELGLEGEEDEGVSEGGETEAVDAWAIVERDVKEVAEEEAEPIAPIPAKKVVKKTAKVVPSVPVPTPAPVPAPAVPVPSPVQVLTQNLVPTAKQRYWYIVDMEKVHSSLKDAVLSVNPIYHGRFSMNELLPKDKVRITRVLVEKK